ncbi:hypothetical protein ACJX0J_009037, partial [Zea mays]
MYMYKHYSSLFDYKLLVKPLNQEPIHEDINYFHFALHTVVHPTITTSNCSFGIMQCIKTQEKKITAVLPKITITNIFLCSFTERAAFQEIKKSPFHFQALEIHPLSPAVSLILLYILKFTLIFEQINDTCYKCGFGAHNHIRQSASSSCIMHPEQIQPLSIFFILNSHDQAVASHQYSLFYQCLEIIITFIPSSKGGGGGIEEDLWGVNPLLP